ncbi:DUF1345 domain-containing protein [Streptomyces virginiae]|uniref:DUF1345 domain-containing protein n=1 Tax=Streptomyces TaxID=1883 RepID=UPI0006901A80|nr:MULTISPECIES: DUF1345 domain-containing protein [Streptomyces]MCX4721761.1 DUF1345 domain-containing protein [Streptomyces virginiae]MCX5277093.1 DUF1345 domain-containing protein [Streptomyces virginiae]MYV72946.1 DUF1345 domain-containing protein [Streptomyces sp. SID1046]WSC81778.1 DUF1345 domain-containing protein [Streptomyces virginiae]
MTGQNPSDTDRTSPREPGPRSAVRTESRWPMAAAVIASAVLTLLLPDDLRLGPRWALPLAEGLLLVALISGDPGRISRRSTVLRSVAVALVVVLVGSAIWSTIQLIDDLIHGGHETNSANALLLAGGSVWSSTVLAFSLLYFELDSGGPAARAHHMPPTPALAFPQQLSPELNAPHWRPHYIDYLYLGFTNSTALSPTDVMPLAPWAKSVMTLQSILSLMILGLVVARAVNVLA